MLRSGTCASGSRPTTRSSSASWPGGYGRCWTGGSASTPTSSTRTSRPGLRMPGGCSSSSPADLRDLLGREPELVVGVVEVRPEPKAGLGPAVDEDRARGELLVDRLEFGGLDDNGAAAPLRLARAAGLEASVLEEVDEHRRLLDRPGADLLDA